MNRSLQVLVLAAGQGRRFGGDKLLAPLTDGRPMLQHTCEALLQAGLQPRCLVRPQDGALQALLDRLGVMWQGVTSEITAPPMSLSLQQGVAATAEAAGWMVVLGDMPFVQPDTYRQLAAGFTQQRERLGPDAAFIVRPCYRPLHADAVVQPGHPVLFNRWFLEELQQLSGDEGGRSLLRTYAEKLQRVMVNDAGVLRDIDVPADLQPAPALV